MIFIANVLVMNGGTTFLIRVCRELKNRGVACSVLLLRPQYDSNLLVELEKHATVIHLSEFLADKGRFFRAQLGVFGVIDWNALRSALLPFNGQVHVMGVFGLLFALRMADRGFGERITVGIYHQNEFMYKAPPFFFAKEAIRRFADIPAENLVFFNVSSRRNYEDFFNRDYSLSTTVPIGIDITRRCEPSDAVDPWRIVSVGNLVDFKTYNEHVIRLLVQLKERFPSIYYDIYGVGPKESELRQLASELGVGDRVHFKGAVPYSEIQREITNAAIFVGSGTALIESAAAGVPALVGIESISTSETYGFLSDIDGLSYNENVPDIPKQPMLPLISRLLTDPIYRFSISTAGRAKASEFSITNTADGFLSLEQTAKLVTQRIPRVLIFRMLLSLLILGVFEKFGWITKFSGRRNQSY